MRVTWQDIYYVSEDQNVCQKEEAHTYTCLWSMLFYYFFLFVLCNLYFTDGFVYYLDAFSKIQYYNEMLNENQCFLLQAVLKLWN